MSIRTTVTLEDDVVDRVKRESRRRGASFRDTLNDLLRSALQAPTRSPSRARFRVKPVHMGYHAGLNYDNVGDLLDYAEGESRR
jgi:hypothetical protein